MQKADILNIPVPRVIAARLRGPEAVAWDSCGYLYTGCQNGWLHRVAIESGEVEVVAELGGRLLGLIVDSLGAVLVCNQDQACVQLVDPVDGSVAIVTTGTLELPMTTPNSIAASPDGTLYVSDSGIWGKRDGRLYAWHPERDTRLLNTSSCLYPNGVAIGQNGTELYLVESELPGIVRYELDCLSNGTDTREVFWKFDANTIPDGVTVCADGSLIVTFYEPNVVVHLADGRARDLAIDPTGKFLAHPTNAAFFGENLARLCIANLGGGLLVELPTELRGAPIRSPASLGNK